MKRGINFEEIENTIQFRPRAYFFRVSISTRYVSLFIIYLFFVLQIQINLDRFIESSNRGTYLCVPHRNIQMPKHCQNILNWALIKVCCIFYVVTYVTKNISRETVKRAAIKMFQKFGQFATTKNNLLKIKIYGETVQNEVKVF